MNPQVNFLRLIRRLLAVVKGDQFGALTEMIDDQANQDHEVPEGVWDDQGWRRLCTSVHIYVGSLGVWAPAQFDKFVALSFAFL